MKSIFVFLSIFCCTALACQPLLRIFDTMDGDESVIRKVLLTVLDEPDILSKNIRNQHTYTCPEGVWMAYKNENYTGAYGEMYILSGAVDGIFRCKYEGDGDSQRIIRSVKVVGAPDDYTASAVVTYRGFDNYGVDTTYLNDTAVTNGTFESLIIVGHETLELFTEEGFRGDSFCVLPNNGDISRKAEFNQKNGWNGTEMYTNLKNLDAIFGTTEFKSFKFGCSM